MEKLKGRDLKFGDLIFVDSRSSLNILGRAIRIMEAGGVHPDGYFMPNHNGIVVEENEDIYQVKVIQSAILGVKVVPLGLWVSHRKCNIVATRYRGHFADYKKRQMKVWLKTKIGLPYDYLSFLPILAKYFLLKCVENPIIRKIIKHLPNPLDSKTRFICSELVFRAFQEVLGVIIWTDIHPSYVSPYDELRSKKFRTVGRYFNYDYGTSR